MPKPRILGRRLPHLQSREESYDPNQGFTTTEDWQMHGGDRLAGKASFYRSVGGSYRLRQMGPKATLVATRSTTTIQQETAAERWELFTNSREFDIREHPKSVALRRLTFDDGRKTRLGQVLEAVDKHNRNVAVDTSSFSTEQLALFDLMIGGGTTYPVWQWVLRYTANVPDTFNFFTEADDGLGTIYTTSQAVASVPAGRLRSTLLSISAPEADSALIWGWLKTASQQAQAAQNRVEISCEFYLAQWPVYIYS
jgi:hypothetical protein